MSFVLKIKRLNEEAKIPAYAYPMDAGFDLCASEEVAFEVGQYGAVPTGLAFEIPEGYVGLVWDKSGLSINHGLKTLAGVIDAGYRGEVKVGMVNLGKETHVFKKGEKVAQMLIQKVEQPIIEVVEELSETHRGEKGFGSSGK
jgi:dUTP pyrophosphatase